MTTKELKEIPLFVLKQYFEHYLERCDYGKMLMIRDEVSFRYKNKMIPKDDLVDYEIVMYNRQINSEGKEFDFSKDSINRYLKSIENVDIKYRCSEKEKRQQEILKDIRMRSAILDRIEIFSNFSY